MNKLFIPIIAVLIIILFLIRFNSCVSHSPLPQVKSDTVVIHDTFRIHDTITGKIDFVKSNPSKHWDTIPKYIPDTNYTNLLKQYNNLGNNFFTQNIYKSSYKLDSFGSLIVIDTISQNKLSGTSMISNIKIPYNRIIITNTKISANKNQLYIGGGLNGNKSSLINSAEVGLILKTNKDQIFQVKISENLDGKINYGIGTYWKIKL
jgi:hypothetical protein